MPIVGPQLAKSITLTKVLAKGLATKPDDLALVSNESRWTWRELDAASHRLAANYLALGLQPGDRVASLLPNRGALFVHYLACHRAGLAATPLNYRYQAPEIDHALEVSGAVILVAHAERDADLVASKLAGKLPLERVSFGATDGRKPSLEELIQTEPPSTKLPAPSPDTVSFIFFTSGSTGKPKGVTHTHETFGWMIASAVAALELTPADVYLPGSSASHVAAISLGLAGLAAGSSRAPSKTPPTFSTSLPDTHPTIPRPPTPWENCRSVDISVLSAIPLCKVHALACTDQVGTP